jgi:predicted signal transduction protein with EAL and GGDEF domain
VTERLNRIVRDTDTVARLGGDEFAILQNAVHTPEDIISFVSRIISDLSEPYDIDGHQVGIGVSVGIALAPGDGLSADELLKNADLALYRAKADGRGTYRFFEIEMDTRMRTRRQLEVDLRMALVLSQFEVFYQPRVSLKDRRVVGCEALLRWKHPERGLIGPAEFIPIIEENGLIVPVGEWVLRTACAQAAKWPAGIRVSVNLSPVQFKSNDLVRAVQTALTSSGLQPDRLELEITESVLLQDTDATLAALAQLQRLGVCISMDDFGAGYCSLSYLRKFAFDRIKIDRAFVKDIDRTGECVAIVRAVVGLGSSLGMETTADGVETEAELAALTAEGCTEGQG